MTVVDSSVVVDVLVDRLALDDVGPGPWNAPDLIESEVLSVLRGLWLGGNLAENDADRLFNAFDDLAINRHTSVQVRRRVWQLRHNLTAYDAVYVALAEQLDTTLFTRDARIARAPGIRCRVEVV